MHCELVDRRWSPEDAAFIASKMWNKPYPRRYGRKEEPMDTDEVVHHCYSFSLLSNDRFGWLDRTGKLWGCGYAQHEWLTDFFGWSVPTLEQAGWWRVSEIVSGRVDPSKKQYEWFAANEKNRIRRDLIVCKVPKTIFVP